MAERRTEKRKDKRNNGRDEQGGKNDEIYRCFQQLAGCGTIGSIRNV
jgi:hypothetical protein